MIALSFKNKHETQLMKLSEKRSQMSGRRKVVLMKGNERKFIHLDQ